MIGQTLINVNASGARTRISTFRAGVFLLILVVGSGDVVAIIPMAALVAVMIIVAVGTFDWHSIQPGTLRRMPKSETTVMMATVAVTVATHNLATGVPTAIYRVSGQLFFASSNDLYTQFDYANDPDQVVTDLTDSHIWDASTVAALDAITTKYARKGEAVEIVGLNEASAERHGRLTGQLPSHQSVQQTHQSLAGSKLSGRP